MKNSNKLLSQKNKFWQDVVSLFLGRGDLDTKVVHIDGEKYRPKFYRRYVLNAMVVMLSDTLVVVAAVLIGKLLLFWINEVSFSMGYGFFIAPAWLTVAAIARLLPGWGLGVVDELRRIQFALFVMFTVVLIVSFLSRADISQSRIVFLITYLISA
ncbi:MAG: hypothetical protein V5783_01495, partial [Pontiella sp.]